MKVEARSKINFSNVIVARSVNIKVRSWTIHTKLDISDQVENWTSVRQVLQETTTARSAWLTLHPISKKISRRHHSRIKTCHEAKSPGTEIASRKE